MHKLVISRKLFNTRFSSELVWSINIFRQQRIHDQKPFIPLRSRTSSLAKVLYKIRPSGNGTKLNRNPFERKDDLPTQKNPTQTGHLHISQPSPSQNANAQKPTSRPTNNQNSNRPQVARPSQRPNVNTNVDSRPTEYENENYGSSSGARPSTHGTNDNYASSNAGRPSTHGNNEYDTSHSSGSSSSGSSFNRPAVNYETSENNYGNTNTGNQVPLFSNTR